MATAHLLRIGDEDVALLGGSGHRRRERAAGCVGGWVGGCACVGGCARVCVCVRCSFGYSVLNPPRSRMLLCKQPVKHKTISVFV